MLGDRGLCMLLWTIQNYTAYENMLKSGLLTANEDYLFCEDDFKFAYNWMTAKMKEHNIIPPQGINYPVWGWYQWEGKRKRRDMRESGHAKRGDKIIQLTIEVPDKEVMLSDFDLFHYVLNYWYLPIDEQDDNKFEDEYKSLGFTWHDLQDFNIQSQEMDFLRKKITSSWNRIFELEYEDDGWLYGKNDKKSIQATFWELQLEQVKKAEIFIAK